MEMALYISCNFLGIVILFILLANANRGNNYILDQRLFRALLYTILTILVVDCIGETVQGKPGDIFYVLNVIYNTAYFILSTGICFLWLLYVYYKVNGSAARLRKFMRIAGIPFYAFSIACLLTPWTKWLFVIDASNLYQRTRLYWLQACTGWAYVFCASIYAIVKGRQQELPDTKREYYYLVLFGVLPGIGSIAQTIQYGLPLTWPLAAISLMIIFINVQSTQISTDSLTGLNNRRQFQRYLLGLLNNSDQCDDLFLIMIDVDKFKKINDTYGHVTGDNVLIYIADVLKHVCAREGQHAFLSRYGGDEFAIICSGVKEVRVSAIVADIHTTLSVDKKNSNRFGQIHVSAGFAKYNPNIDKSLDDFINRADKEMYRNKEF